MLLFGTKGHLSSIGVKVILKFLHIIVGCRFQFEVQIMIAR